MNRKNFRARPIDISKPLQIIIGDLQGENDEDVGRNRGFYLSGYHDTDSQNIEDLTFEPTIEESRKEVPVPTVKVVELQETGYKPNFKYPKGFIRWKGITYEEEKTRIDYDIEEDDIDWLNKINSESQIKLTEDELEKIIDRLEKATGFSQTLVPLNTVYEILPEFKDKADLLKKAYVYWRQKRMSRVGKYYPCGRPLIQNFEVDPDPDDTNPYVAFRPRVSEKPPRKGRKNSPESLRRLKQMRKDFEKLRIILELIKKREKLKHELYLQNREILRIQLKDVKKRRPIMNGFVETSDITSIDDHVNTLHKGQLRLSELLHKLKECKKPLFSFLVQLNKIDHFEGDEVLPKRNTTIRFGRGGRIIFDRNELKNNSDTSDDDM